MLELVTSSICPRLFGGGSQAATSNRQHETAYGRTRAGRSSLVIVQTIRISRSFEIESVRSLCNVSDDVSAHERSDAASSAVRAVHRRVRSAPRNFHHPSSMRL